MSKESDKYKEVTDMENAFPFPSEDASGQENGQDANANGMPFDFTRMFQNPCGQMNPFGGMFGQMPMGQMFQNPMGQMNQMSQMFAGQMNQAFQNQISQVGQFGQMLQSQMEQMNPRNLMGQMNPMQMMSFMNQNGCPFPFGGMMNPMRGLPAFMNMFQSFANMTPGEKTKEASEEKTEQPEKSIVNGLDLHGLDFGKLLSMEASPTALAMFQKVLDTVFNWYIEQK